jgi:hypothetical protein
MYNNGNTSRNVTGASIVDGTVETVDIADDAVTADKLANSVNTDIGTGVTASTTAGDALPKAGGTMTGTIAGFTSTGIDDNATSTKLTVADTGIDVTGSVTCDSATVDSTLIAGVVGYQIKTSKSNGSNSAIIHRSDTGGNLEFRSGSTDYNQIFLKNGGNVGIGTSGPTHKLDVSNQATFRDGITFNGDTAAANALDDYEEGYHNAALTCGTSGTVTVSYNRLNYVKIGRQVTLSGEIVVSAISSPSGGIYMSLPFQNAASTERSARTAYFMDSHSWNAAPDGRVIAYLDSSVTTAQLQIKNQSYSGYETTNYIQVGTTIKVNFTYQAQ